MRSNLSRSSLMTVAVAAFVICGAGCASDTSPYPESPATRAKSVAPPVGAIPEITDWHQISLPLDAYKPTLRDEVAIQHAVQRQVASCMSRFGLVYDPPSTNTLLGRADVSASQDAHGENAGIFGLLDEKQAERLGYHPPKLSLQERERYEKTQLDYSEAKRPQGYENVFRGGAGGSTYKGRAVPDGGCVGEALRSLGGAEFNPSLPEHLAGDAWMQAKSDSRVQAAFANWSACMADAGFHYADPMQANDDSRWSGDTASKAEIAVAVADVRCKKSTNVTGVWAAVDAAYQRVAMKGQMSALQSLKEAQERVVSNAARINGADS